MTVSETNFHLFQGQQKLGTGNAIVPLQVGLRIAPEVLDPVDVPTAAGREAFTMIDPVVPVAVGDQPLVVGELVRVDRAALGYLLADHCAKGFSGHMGNRTGIHLAAPLQEPEDRHVAGRASASESLAVPSEVGLVSFDLAAQRGAVCTVPRHMLADRPIDPLGTVPLDPDDASRLHGRDLQGKEVNELVELSVR